MGLTEGWDRGGNDAVPLLEIVHVPDYRTQLEIHRRPE